ncbi:pyridoxal phosphate phosphatase PHOSPHO2-like [Clytia hemisphaerica]|uniref:pyridoxal phosphate phosphatase PHOSPHO2-like n=1 Tax=Clytia hemisphaerica TaxID=252671 RepID=UPI0034D6ED86
MAAKTISADTPQAQQDKKEILLIFDFDNTIIDKNTDSEIIKAQNLYGKCLSGKRYLKNDLGWAETMSLALADLHQNNISQKDIDKIIEDIPLTPGFETVFEFIRQNRERCECIMLSHSNSYFIDLLVKKYSIGDCFDSIHTYEAEWMKDGPLLVKPYHPFLVNCQICPPDFCKGVFVETYREQTEWSRDMKWKNIFYVGDGTADFCAALSLQCHEHVLTRTGYSMHKRLLKDKGDKFKANMIEWNNGHDVEKILKSRIDDAI